MISPDRRALALDLWSFRDYRMHQTARFLNTVGSQMASVAIGWQVWDRTHSTLALGYVGLAQFVPSVALVLLTGHVADRYDRRSVVFFCTVAMTLCWLALFAITSSTEAPLWAVYSVLLAFGAVRAFAAPAGSSLLPSLVPREHLGRALALSSTVWQVGTIAGPALGGVLVVEIHPGGVYLAAVALCAIAALCVSQIRVRRGVQGTRGFSWSTLLAGVRYVAEEKILLGTISLDLFAVLLGGAVALLPVFAREILSVGPFGLGVLRSAPAAGASVMALVLAWRPISRHAGRWMLSCVGIFGLATVLFGMSRNFWLSLLALVLVGASDMVSVVVRSHAVQGVTPDAMRGRVSAVNQVFVGASNELGEFESGLTASWWGAERAVIAGGIGTCLVVLLWAGLFPSLRRLDRLDPLEGLRAGKG